MDTEALGSPDPTMARRVEALAGYGIAEPDIARILRLDPEVLHHAYREELDTGGVKATSRVAENLYRKATGDDREAVTAAIFWLKARARWSETIRHETDDPASLPERTPRQLAMAVLAIIRAGSRETEGLSP